MLRFGAKLMILFVKGSLAFGGYRSFAVWLQSPCPALSRMTPADVIIQGGICRVEAIIEGANKARYTGLLLITNRN
jgi:hypothetical protein